MGRKISAVLLSALAFSALALVPAMAQAKVTLSSPPGTVLGAGAPLTLTNSGNLYFSSAGGAVLATCSTAVLGGTVTENPGAAISISSGAFAGTGEGGRCPSSAGFNTVVEPVLLALPATATFAGNTFASSKLTLEYKTYVKGSLSQVCEYTGEINGDYSPGSEAIKVALTEEKFTFVKGNASCATSQVLSGSLAPTSNGNPVTAQTEGLYRSAEGTRIGVVKGEKIQAQSGNFKARITAPGGESVVECTSATLAGSATDPLGSPAVVSINEASFTGKEVENRCKTNPVGPVIKLTTNASSGWLLNLSDKTGGPSTGELTGSPMKFTIDYSGVTICTYEATSIGVSYKFEENLGLKMGQTKLTPTKETGPCSYGVKIEGDFAVTAPNAGNQPIGVWAG